MPVQTLKGGINGLVKCVCNPVKDLLEFWRLILPHCLNNKLAVTVARVKAYIGSIMLMHAVLTAFKCCCFIVKRSRGNSQDQTGKEYKNIVLRKSL